MNAPGNQTEVSPNATSLELIRKLVSFDTTSRDSNLALIEWVKDYVEQLGAGTRLTFDDERRKANLFATFAANDGNTTSGGIVLSGHTDVVPVDGQPWNSDPFQVTLKDDKIFGRGVTDMKSFIAIGLASVPDFLRRGLKKPLHFALSYDEETGCIGAHRLVADIVRESINPAGCIIGEPTGMRLVVAHKAKESFRCRVRGRVAHSALTTQGVNAVQIACEIVSHITNMAQRLRDQGRRDDAYDIPYTTVHTGVIHGGTALNIVPRDCWFEFEFRHLPFDDPATLLAEVKAFAEEFLPEMHSVDPTTGITFEHISGLPGFDSGGDSQIATLGRELTASMEFGKVSFATEAPLFHRAGIATIVCGPGHIEQAHQPNEWISLEQLAHCEAFMRRLAAEICAS